jgi:hypothetical protein
MTSRSFAVAVAVVLATGCGDNTSSSQPDATLDRPCWPIETSVPGGEIELGTGNVSFEPMPASIPFILGGQGGTFLYLNARIRGLEPGDPTDLFAARNPRTRFQVVLGDGTVVGPECGASVGFRATADDGYFERAAPQQQAFLPYSLGERAFDTNVQIIVEVIDIDGNYARDEKTVFTTRPAGTFDGVVGALPSIKRW